MIPSRNPAIQKIARSCRKDLGVKTGVPCSPVRIPPVSTRVDSQEEDRAKRYQDEKAARDEVNQTGPELFGVCSTRESYGKVAPMRRYSTKSHVLISDDNWMLENLGFEELDLDSHWAVEIIFRHQVENMGKWA